MLSKQTFTFRTVLFQLGSLKDSMPTLLVWLSTLLSRHRHLSLFFVFYFSTCLKKNHKNGGKGREYGLFLLPFIFPILVTNTYIDSQVPVPPAILKLRLIHSCRPGYVQIQEGMPCIISIFQKYKYVLTEGDRALHRKKNCLKFKS